MPKGYHFLLPNSGYVYGPLVETDPATFIHEQTHLRCYRTTSYGDALRWCDWTLAISGMAIAQVCPGIYEPPRLSALQSTSIRFAHDLSGLSTRERRRTIANWIKSSVQVRRARRSFVGTFLLSLLSLVVCRRAIYEVTAASIIREFLTDGRPPGVAFDEKRALAPTEVLKAFRFMDRNVTANRARAVKRFSQRMRGRSWGWKRRFGPIVLREESASSHHQMLSPLPESGTPWERMIHEVAWTHFPKLGTSGKAVPRDGALCPFVKRADGFGDLAITGSLVFECLAGLTEMHWKVQMDAFEENSEQPLNSPLTERPAPRTLNEDEIALFDFISGCLGAKGYEELREGYNHASFFWDFGLHYVLLLSALMPPVPSGHRLPTILDRLFGRVCGPSHLNPGHRLLILLDFCEASPELRTFANRELISEALARWRDASLLNDNEGQEAAMRAETDSMEQMLDTTFLAFCTALGFGRANAHPIARMYLSLEQMAHGDDGYGFCYGMFREDRDASLRRWSCKYKALPSVRSMAGARPLLMTLGYLTNYDFPNGFLDRQRWAVVPPEGGGKEELEAKEQLDRMFLGIECFLIKYGFQDSHCASGRTFPLDIEQELAELADRRKARNGEC